MLSNAYFLAKFRFDTAENEPAKNLQNFAKFANFADPNPLTLTLKPQGGTAPARCVASAAGAALHEGHAPGEAAEAAACGCSNSKLERNVPT